MSEETAFLVFFAFFYGIIIFMFLYFLYVMAKLLRVLQKDVEIRKKELEFFENNEAKIKIMEVSKNSENQN